MTAKRSLADLAAAFSKKTNESSGNQNWKLFFPFWKAPVDSVTTIRFLPDADADNHLGFLVENLTHELYVNGKKETVGCLKMYGEECPICELSAKFYNKTDPEYNEELGKKFYRKKSYIGQVLVLESQVEHDHNQLVKLIEFGPQIFKQIHAGFISGDMDAAPYELKDGYNFRIRKTQTGGGQNSYSTSNFAPKQTPVADDVIAQLNLYKLSDYRAAKTSREALEAMLLAAASGAPAPAPAPVGSDDDDVPAQAPAPVAAPAPAPVAAPAVSGATGGLSVVEMLRQRAAQQAAAAE